MCIYLIVELDINSIFYKRIVLNGNFHRHNVESIKLIHEEGG